MVCQRSQEDYVGENMINNIDILKAQGIPGKQVDDLTINIRYTIADNSRYSISEDSGKKELEGVFQTQGEVLEDHLRKVLPGGTYDQLLLAMLKSKASLYIVPRAEISIGEYSEQTRFN